MSKRPSLTRWEFTQRYNETTKLTPERMRDLGMEAESCTCADPHCRGWKMTTEKERRRERVATNAKSKVAAGQNPGGAYEA